MLTELGCHGNYQQKENFSMKDLLLRFIISPIVYTIITIVVKDIADPQKAISRCHATCGSRMLKA